MPFGRWHSTEPDTKLNIELITIGDELLDGRVVDSNAAWLSNELTQRGWVVGRHCTIPDDIDAIKDALAESIDRSHVCICTGGLGPTSDDVTAEAVARLLGCERTVNEKAFIHLKERLGARPLTDAQLNQCRLPEGAVAHTHEIGTAPSFRVEIKACVVYCMPGVPREVIKHAETSIFPTLSSRQASHTLKRQRLVTSGIGESRLAELIDEPTLPSDIQVGFRSGVLENEVLLAARDEQRLANAFNLIRGRLGVAYLGDGISKLADATVRSCRQSGLTLGTAESCTGGLIGAELTSIPGSSDVFQGGIVSYSNRVKIEQLGVNEETINEFGAVSEACALEMATGARRALACDIAVAVTGIAGPGGGSVDKPVGTVCLAWVSDDWQLVETHRFRGDRNMVRLRTVGRALDVIRRQLNSE